MKLTVPGYLAMPPDVREAVDAWLAHHGLHGVVACAPLDESGCHLVLCTVATVGRQLHDRATDELVLTTYEFHADCPFPADAWRYVEAS